MDEIDMVPEYKLNPIGIQTDAGHEYLMTKCRKGYDLCLRIPIDEIEVLRPVANIKEENKNDQCIEED